MCCAALTSHVPDLLEGYGQSQSQGSESGRQFRTELKEESKEEGTGRSQTEGQSSDRGEIDKSEEIKSDRGTDRRRVGNLT